MARLAMALFSMIATILASVGVVVVLVAGYGTLLPIISAAFAGLGLAVPVTWYVVKEFINH
ncbi:MAG: CTP synthetase [Rhodobacteraceae bacterium]|nr:CTP synthetase [Paracoccaceae bacterium]